MVSPLDDMSVIQHHDGVGVAHGGKTVGDDKDGSALHQVIHALFNQPFCPGIDAAGGFVQNQDRRIGYGCPGDGQQLALPLGKSLAVPGDPGVISFWHPSDKRVGVGQNRCLAYFLIGGVQFSKPDIVGNGTGEQMGILQDDAQGAAKRLFLISRTSIPS